MPSTTPAMGLPYPLGTDPVADGDDAIKALAERVEAVYPRGRRASNVGGTYNGLGPATIVDVAAVPTLTGRRYRITGRIRINRPTPGEATNVVLKRNGANVYIENYYAQGASQPLPVTIFHEMTGDGVASTWALEVSRLSGGSNIGVDGATWLMCDDVGPATPAELVLRGVAENADRADTTPADTTDDTEDNQ